MAAPARGCTALAWPAPSSRAAERAERQSEFEALGAAVAKRYLCSCHKEYWANNDQFVWGLQIHAQHLAAAQG